MTRFETDVNEMEECGSTKKRREWQPHTKITHDSFYPPEGYGNHSGVFNVIKGNPIPPSHTPRKPTRERTSTAIRRPRHFELYYAPPINKSSLFEVVQLPADRYFSSKGPRIERNLYHMPRNNITNEVEEKCGATQRCPTISPSTSLSVSSSTISSTNIQSERNHIMETQEKHQEKNVEFLEGRLTREPSAVPSIRRRTQSAGAYLRHLDSHLYMELRQPGPARPHEHTAGLLG